MEVWRTGQQSGHLFGVLARDRVAGVLHRFFVGVELDNDEVVARPVAVFRDRGLGSKQGIAAIILHLLREGVLLVDSRGLKPHDMNKARHSAPPIALRSRQGYLA